jgi:hypothetical protein
MTRKLVPAIILCVALAACTREDDEMARRKLEKAKQELKTETRQAGEKLKDGAHRASEELKEDAHKANEKLKGAAQKREDRRPEERR